MTAVPPTVARAAARALFAAALCLPAPASARQVCAFVARFDGPDRLGAQVATVLHLQIWQTLRRAPTPNPAGLDFGAGIVMWGDAPPARATFDAAEAIAPAGCQLVLWGSVSRIAGGVVVQAYLSIPAVPGEPPLWKVGTGPAAVAVDFPRRRFAFAPIVLRREVVDRFSTADALATYPKPGAAVPNGKTGDAFRAARQEGDWALLDGAPERWVYLPSLSTERSEVVDFAGALVRLLRGDLDGAAALLGSVIANAAAPSSLKADALLLRALAAERAGRRGDDDLRRAAALAPLSDAVARYRVALALAAYVRAGGILEAREKLLRDVGGGGPEPSPREELPRPSTPAATKAVPKIALPTAAAPKAAEAMEAAPKSAGPYRVGTASRAAPAERKALEDALRASARVAPANDPWLREVRGAAQVK